MEVKVIRCEISNIMIFRCCNHHCLQVKMENKMSWPPCLFSLNKSKTFLQFYQHWFYFSSPWRSSCPALPWLFRFTPCRNQCGSLLHWSGFLYLFTTSWWLIPSHFYPPSSLDVFFFLFVFPPVCQVHRPQTFPITLTLTWRSHVADTNLLFSLIDFPLLHFEEMY